jgi:hypothetical protein
MNKIKNSLFSRVWLAKTTVFLMILNLFLLWGLPVAQAATVSSLSDNLTRLQASTLADHEIKFVTPTGIAGTQTVTLTFGAAFTMGTFNVNNVDFATGNSNNCASASYTEQTLASSASGATWGIAQAGQVITLTSGSGTATAGNCVRFRIGSNAVTGGSGVSQITNGSAGATTATVAIAGTFGDVGTLFIPIISNDQVTVSATVVPSISFSISSNSIGFGTLVTGNARFATSDSVGSSTEVSAHNLIVGTNAASGYNLYMLGGTLTSATSTIAAIGGSMASSTPGTAQFGVRFAASGGVGSSLTPYNAPTSYAFGSTATTQSAIGTASGPSANTTYTAYYVANITALTPAGSYATTLTYTAVGSF